MSQEVLYGMVYTRTEHYQYRINSGGGYHIGESGIVCITFRDGKFADATYPAAVTMDSRNGIRIIGAVAELVTKLEEGLKPTLA